jgi:uncharacterized SAM-binding protein YcdF (DUF218 family)
LEDDDLRRLWRFLARETALLRSDVIFVFGSADPRVAHQAFELHARGIALWVLVSGGTTGGYRAGESEADAYREVLQARGMPTDRIVVERRALNTGENVSFGMAAVAARGIEVNRATLVAFPSSLRRCAATFSWQHPRVEIATVAAFDQSRPFGRDAEAVASAVLAEIDRLTIYPRLGHIGPQPLPDWVTEAAGRLRASMPSAPLSVLAST